MALTTQTKTVKVHLISVKRGGEDIVTTGADYDLRILRSQHPPENVKVLEKDYDVIKIPDDAAHLHDQLCRKYDTKNVKVVGRVFPSPEQLSMFAGVTVRTTDLDPDAGPQKSVQRDHGRAKRLAEAAQGESKGGKGKGSSAPPAPPADPKPDGNGQAETPDPTKLGDAAKG